MANDFSLDPDAIAWWRCNNDGTAGMGDGVGTNVLTNSGTVLDTTNKREGNASMWCNNTTDGAYITDVNLDAGFPFKSDASNPKFTIWWWQFELTPNSNRTVLAKGSTGAGDLTLLVVYNYPAKTTSFYIGTGTGSTSELLFTSSHTTITFHWSWWALSWDDKTKTARLYVYHLNTDTVDDDVTVVASNNIHLDTGTFVWGNSVSFNVSSGWRYDEMGVIARVLTTEEMQQIITQTYVYTPPPPVPKNPPVPMIPVYPTTYTPHYRFPLLSGGSS